MRTNQLSFFSYNLNFAESYYLTPPILFTMPVTVVGKFFRACVKHIKKVVGMSYVHSSASFPLTIRISSTRCSSERNFGQGRHGRCFGWRWRRRASGRGFWPRQPRSTFKFTPFHVWYSRLMFGLDFREQCYHYGGELFERSRRLSRS